MEIIKYPHIKYLGDDENKGILDGHVVFTEKIDGGNFRFWFADGKLHFGSRNRELIEEKDKDQFKRCIDYIIKILNNFPKLPAIILEARYEFFGEACFKHTINYDWNKIPPFIGYSIYDTHTHKFLSWCYVKIIFSDLGFTTVPEADTDCYYTIPKSKFYQGNAEGIVFFNYDKQLFAKIVSPEFKEENKKAFGTSKKHAENDDEKVVMTYCTNARINKAILSLRDSGHPIGMPLMKNLYELVWIDIIEEHYKDILLSNYQINIKGIRRLISKRCLEVLKTYMINQELK